MSDAVAAGPSAGRLLRQAREAAGLHVAALAVSLKVPVRKLEALEDDRYEELPDLVFARALASSMCRTLKIDPQPILERLPQGSAPRLVSEREPINAPFRAPGEPAGPGWFDQLTRPVFLAVFALLLGALVIIFLPTAKRDETATAKPAESPGVPMAAPTLTPESPASAPGAEPAAAGDPAPRPVAAIAAAVPVAAPASTPAPAARPASSPAATATPTAPAAAASASAAAPAATGLVVFKATGPSWVQVMDANGAVALRRLLADGETAGASGALPLAVTVGSVNATSVQVRGKPYDLAPVSKDNVARFEVK